MTIHAFLQIVVFAWQSFWRNIWLSIVTITLILLAFISINFLIILNVMTSTAIDLVKDKVDVSVYFNPEVPEPEVLEVQIFLEAVPQVRDVIYISQQQALEKFRQRHQQDFTIIQSLEELNDNPLNATLIIKAKNINDYPGILEILNNSKYDHLIQKKNFDDHEVYIEKIKEVSDNVNRVGFFAAIVFILVACLIVFNTIRVAIYTHQKEIGIMKLVGATNWFIRSPFLFESLIYGILAWALSLAVVFPLLNVIQPRLNSFFLTENFNIINYFTGHFWSIFGLELLAIILLNIICSSIAIRRYLKV